MNQDRVRALYNYDASAETCLSFRKGDIIKVFSKDASGWWDGILNNQRGWFPSNYVENIPKVAATSASSQNNGSKIGKNSLTQKIWDSIISNAHSKISELNNSVKRNIRKSGLLKTAEIISMIKNLLVAENDDLKLNQSIEIRNQSENLLLKMAKLIVSSRTAALLWPPSDSVQVFRYHSGQLLLSLKVFFDTAIESNLIPEQSICYTQNDFNQRLTDMIIVEIIETFGYYSIEISSNIEFFLDSVKERRELDIVEKICSIVSHVGRLLSFSETVDFFIEDSTRIKETSKAYRKLLVSKTDSLLNSIAEEEGKEYNEQSFAHLSEEQGLVDVAQLAISSQLHAIQNTKKFNLEKIALKGEDAIRTDDSEAEALAMIYEIFLEEVDSLLNDDSLKSLSISYLGTNSFLETNSSTPKLDYRSSSVSNSTGSIFSKKSTESLTKQASNHGFASLIDQILCQNSIHDTTLHSFLLSFHIFGTSKQLMDRVQHFIDNKNDSDFRLNVLKFLRVWLENYWIESLDGPCLQTIYSLINNQTLERTPESMHLNDVLSKKINQKNITYSNPFENKLNQSSSTFRNILQTKFDPIDIARQLTLIEFRHFVLISPHEFLKQEWSAQKIVSKATNIRAMATLSTNISMWVIKSILSQEDVKKRALTLKFFIKVTQKCISIFNFNTAMALKSALQSSAIHRLKKTWAILPEKSKVALDLVSEATNHSKNYSEYRKTLKNAPRPCLPFLGLYLTDLTFIDQGNSDFLADGKEINIEKYIKIYQIIKEIQSYKTQYQFIIVKEIQTYLEYYLYTNENFDSEELYQTSLKLEPRENETSSSEQKLNNTLVKLKENGML